MKNFEASQKKNMRMPFGHEHTCTFCIENKLMHFHFSFMTTDMSRFALMTKSEISREKSFKLIANKFCIHEERFKWNFNLSQKRLFLFQKHHVILFKRS